MERNLVDEVLNYPNRENGEDAIRELRPAGDLENVEPHSGCPFRGILFLGSSFSQRAAVPWPRC